MAYHACQLWGRTHCDLLMRFLKRFQGDRMDKSARNYPLEDIDRETMFHPNTSIVDHLKKGPHILAQARGVRVKDHQGRELIDCGAGLWCVNIGYGRKEMAEAAKKAIENLAYSHIF